MHLSFPQGILVFHHLFICTKKPIRIEKKKEKKSQKNKQIPFPFPSPHFVHAKPPFSEKSPAKKNPISNIVQEARKIKSFLSAHNLKEETA